MAIIINPYTVPHFIAGIISLILGILALYKNPKDKPTQVFFILMMGCTLWSLTPIVIQAQGSEYNALLLGKASNIGFLLIPMALLHFSFLFGRKKTIKFSKIAIIYVIAIIFVVILVGTNLFFTVAEDKLIDGDGLSSTGRGEGNYNEELYDNLPEDDLKLFQYIDSNDDNYYNVENRTMETLAYDGNIIVGHYDGNSNWSYLNESENYYLIWFVDENEDGSYTIGESLYLENGDGNQQLVYFYVPGPLYFVLLIYFFGFIIGSIINLLYFFLTKAEKNAKKPILYLTIGLIAIIIIILLQPLLVDIIPEIVVLDSAITLVISLFFTVAVLKYNIVDIKLIIRKSMFYSMASVVVVASFVLVEEGMEILFNTFAFSGSIYSGIIAAFVALILFSIIKRGLKTQIDKLFPAVRLMDKEYQSRIEAYRATLFAMLVDGIISPKEQSAIETLKNKLDIQQKEHDQLLTDLERELGPLKRTSS